MIEPYTARPYQGDHELTLLNQFVRDINGLAMPHSFPHVGDIQWNTCFSTELERQRTIRLWERDGALWGVAWFEAPNSVTCMVHPSSRGSGELEAAMFAWAADLARSHPQPDDARLWTTALASDTAYIDYLTGSGFERGDTSAYRMTQALDNPIPASHLQSGWQVRAVADDEGAQRVDLHREVWQPSSLTLDKYRALQASPVFVPALDLVAVAPAGTFAAYAGGWLDRQNGIGLFEPVGTRAAFRRQGLSSAIIREGMRRMQALGARSVWISTGAVNKAAASLYMTLGFQSVDEFRYGVRLK